MSRALNLSRAGIGLVGDASGNVGIGVAPNAWNSAGKAVELSTGGLFAYPSVGSLNVTNNAYFGSSGWVYSTTAAASRYFQNAGAHQWFSAPSGTAGTAVTFTQAMTLDPSGNLLVGTSTVSNGAGWDKLVQVYSAQYPTVSLKNGYRQWDWSISGSSGALILYDTTAGAERARFDSSGNLGLGTTGPGAPLHIYSGTQEQIRLGRNTTGSSGYITFFANNSSSAQVQYAGILGDVSSSTAGSHAGNLLFYVTGAGTSAERARIDSSGRLLVGTTYTPSSFPAKGTSVSGGVLYSHECSFGGPTKVVTFSGDFNYFCELTVTVWTNASAGIYQGKFIAGRRDWTGANHMANYADQIGTALDYSLSTSDSSNTRTFTITFSCSADTANLHWSIESKTRNLLSFSIT